MKAKALQLADEALAKEYAPRLEIAKELRRLHLENEQLKAREWVGLTDEDKAEILSRKWWNFEDEFDLAGFSGLIEAKLKEKNNAP